MTANTKVTTFIEDLQLVSAVKADLVIALRQLFIKSSSELSIELSEDIKYGGVVFTLANSSTLIAGIYPYTNHVSVEFSNGVSLADRNGFLAGKGKKRRHVIISELQDIASKDVAGFVAEIILLADSSQ